MAIRLPVLRDQTCSVRIELLRLSASPDGRPAARIRADPEETLARVADVLPKARRWNACDTGNGSMLRHFFHNLTRILWQSDEQRSRGVSRGELFAE